MSEMYIHGVSPEEQTRLSRLNDLLNARMLAMLDLSGVRSVLDVGSGLGQLTRDIARAIGPSSVVIGVERDDAQRRRALELAEQADEAGLVEFRAGDALDPPLTCEEWGSFDLVHARFILEHVREPERVAAQMVRAVKPGGTVVAADDDHTFFIADPPAAALERVWRAYIASYRVLGADPFIGRRLVRLLRGAGLVRARCAMIPTVATHGELMFQAYVDNWRGLLLGARELMLERDLLDRAAFDAGLRQLDAWSRLKDASFWYAFCWASAKADSATAID